MPSWGKIILANSRATDSARVLLLAFGEVADRFGLCSMPVKDLATLCNVSPRQVQRDLLRLSAIHELTEEYAGGGRGRPAGYRITLTPTSPFPNHKRVTSTKGVLGKETLTPTSPFHLSRGRAHKRAAELQVANANPKGSSAAHDDQPSPFRNGSA